MANRFESLAAPGVRRLAPYVPGKPPEQLERELGIKDSIKLASNENPLGPGAAAQAALAAAVAGVGLYPDGSGLRACVRASRHAHGLQLSQVTLGNGSNDILVLLAETFLTPELEAVYSQYAFAVYPIAVQAASAGARVAQAHPADHAMPLGHDPRGDPGRDRTAHAPRLPREPEQPDGHLDGRAANSTCCCARFRREVIVVLDEAYHEYSAARRRARRHALARAAPESRRHAHVLEGLWPRGPASRLCAVATRTSPTC